MYKARTIALSCAFVDSTDVPEDIVFALIGLATEAAILSYHSLWSKLASRLLMARAVSLAAKILIAMQTIKSKGVVPSTVVTERDS